MEKMRIGRTDVKRVNIERDLLKWTSKPSYMLQKISENHLITIRIAKLYQH